MGEAEGMECKPNDPATVRCDHRANVIPFPITRVTGGDTPPSACRDPRRYPYGLLIVERRIAGGANGFHWFSNEAEAAHFLRCGLWPFIGNDDAADSLRSIYAEALRTTSRINDEWLMDVSEQQDDVLVIWHGLFDTLVSGGDRFALGVVEDFRQMVSNCGKRGFDIQRFIDYLSVFRGESKRGT